MDLNSVTNTNQSYNSSNSSVGKVEFPVQKRSEVETAPVQIAAVENIDVRQLDQKKLDTLRENIKKAFANSYVVSDRSFAIYKDTSGQYITRFTNLRDGTVTYIPEQEILKYTGSNDSSFLQFSA
ncbi:MAG: hypothetical protein K2Q12_04105 [Rickettsiales bacterium]|nr:hypothetical protein [Rickettsiales bacterium]